MRNDGIKNIYVLDGEYEGYKEYSKTLGIHTTEVSQNADISALEKGVFFISNPSARNGNIIPNKFINDICDSGHKVVLDLAYVGMTKQNMFDVSHENISQVFMSLSKPYGVFRFRIGGFEFSREPIESLYGNKWFKDVPSLLTALKLVEEIPPGSLNGKYSAIQKEIITKINENHDLDITPSDVFLLGHMEKTQALKLDKYHSSIVNQFIRGDYLRFCLTPYFEEYEAQKDRPVLKD